VTLWTQKPRVHALYAAAALPHVRTMRRTRSGERARRAGPGAAVVALSLALVASLAACGGNQLGIVEPGSIAALDACLEKHGVPSPQNVGHPTTEELAIPGLLGFYGAPIPRGVTRVAFEQAVKACGGNLHVGREPISNSIVERQIEGLRGCLAKNGFTLSPPDFAGPGPVLDTRAAPIASARWVATVRGCEVSARLTGADLRRCMGAAGLTGSAKTNPAFEDRYLQLPHCLRTRAG
jgi:hypothetical protein